MMPLVISALLLQAVAGPPTSPAVPFAAGETLEYSGRYLMLSPGGATMRVVGVDTVEGVPDWHFKLTMNVSVPFYKNHSDLESWTGVNDFISHRFLHAVTENGKQISNDDFHIFSDSGYYRNHNDTATRRTPKRALDDLAFIYYLRMMTFKQDSTYRIPRYFRDDHNPVLVTVIGHDTLDMPDGSRRSCWLLHPIVDEPGGMFSRKANAKIWLTDDGVRIPVQIQSDFGPTHLTLRLKKVSKAP